jgi:hypothetical protein
MKEESELTPIYFKFLELAWIISARIESPIHVERIENPAGCKATLASCKVVSGTEQNNSP